jgi:hypothetical protein
VRAHSARHWPPGRGGPQLPVGSELRVVQLQVWGAARGPSGHGDGVGATAWDTLAGRAVAAAAARCPGLRSLSQKQHSSKGGLWVLELSLESRVVPTALGAVIAHLKLCFEWLGK